MLITNLNEFKDSKKFKKIISDLENILVVINKSQEAFKFFKHYALCQEIISVLETNKTLVEIYRKQYNDRLVEVKKKYTIED